MRHVLKLICPVVFAAWFSAVSGLAATVYVSCDYLSISNACATAQEGDVLLIQPGDCVISNTITINRNLSFTIRGSGTNQTTLRSAPGLNLVIGITTDSTNVFTVSDLNCVGALPNTCGFFSTGGSPPAPPMNGLFHFYNLQMTNVLGRGISIGYCDSFGLIDHCYFSIGANPGGYNPVIFGGNAYKSWASPNPLGTTNVCCVEDCYFKNTSGSIGNGFFDGYNGGQAVVRHCVFDGVAATGCHGYDSQVTAMRTLELYDNVFTNINGYNAGICGDRGGVYMCFSNTIYITTNFVTGVSIAPQLTYYRGCNGSYQGAFGYAGYNKTNTYSTNWIAGNSVVFGTEAYTFTAAITGGYQPNYVLLGSSLAQSLTNLALAIDGDPATVGAKYSSYATRNADFIVQTLGTNYLILKNVLDGTNAYGWPAAFQNGVLSVTQYTNAPVTLFPCYSCSNLVVNCDGSTCNINFILSFVTWPGNGMNYITNLLAAGRDYYQDTPPPYRLLLYPHPLQALESAGTTGGSGSSAPPASLAPPSNLVVFRPAGS